MVTQILTFTKSSGVWGTTPVDELLNVVRTVDTTGIEYLNALGSTNQYIATHDLVSETVYTITREWLDLDAYATYTALNSINNNTAALNAIGISVTSETID